MYKLHHKICMCNIYFEYFKNIIQFIYYTIHYVYYIDIFCFIYNITKFKLIIIHTRIIIHFKFRCFN